MENTKLQPLHEALIYIEENEAVELNGFGKWGKNAAKGILGKMEAMGLIERFVSGEKSMIRLSQAGYDFLNTLLDALHGQIIHWDGKWRMVWFSVPEKSRSMRDKFRRGLEQIGMRPILNSLWISPLPVISNVLALSEKLSLKSNIAAVEVSDIQGISKRDILKGWNLDLSQNEFYGFIEKYAQVDVNQLSAFDAKKIIFEYALILSGEPKLPIELFPSDWPRYRADQIYKRVKKSLE